MTTNDNEKSPKSRNKYFCKLCNYSTSRNDQYERHLSTSKHKKTTNDNEKSPKSRNKYYECINCCKLFNDRAGLWRHNNKCVDQPNISINDQIQKNDSSDKELIIMLIKQNSELMKDTNDFKNMMMDVIKNGTHNTINNTNSHNKSFNLQFFLNETCKDAMNITDFVESIKLQLSDLERVGEVGYIEGISNLITTNLKALDAKQRPVHCTDKKRETMYIKDKDKWEKEDENKSKIRMIIKRVANKNITLLPKFREKYPDYNNSSSKLSDKYDHIIIESMGGSGNNDIEKEDKIIHNISKCVIIDK